MIMRILVAAMLAGAPALAADRNTTPDGKQSCVGHEANRELYFKVLDVIFNGIQLDRVEEFFADDFVNHAAPKWAAQGPAAIRQYLPLMKGAFPDRKVIHDFVMCDGDFVVARTHVTGTSKGPYFGRPPTGKSYDVTGTDIYWIKDGKIHGRWGNEDAMGMMEQLGYNENRGGPK